MTIKTIVTKTIIKIKGKNIVTSNQPCMKNRKNKQNQDDKDNYR